MQILMPRLTDAGAPGTVSEIFVGVGDAVEEGAAVMAVELDKAIVDVEATASGMVKAIPVRVGETVEVGQVLIELG